MIVLDVGLEEEVLGKRPLEKNDFEKAANSSSKLMYKH
jgi:hypothetical protein